MTVQLPGQLSEMVNNLGGAAQSLAEEVRADRAERAAREVTEAAERRRTQRRQTGLLVIVAVLVLALVGLSISNRLLGNQNRSVIKAIESCTDPTGDCAVEGQRRTEEAIGKLLRMNIEVASCARTEPTDRDYRACVDRALADLMETPPAGSPSPPAAPSRTPAPTPAPSAG